MSNGGDTPHISVIIPTHNRRDSLRRLLDALCAQTYPLRRVEVIVVADGCKDDTAEMVRGYHAPFALHVIEQPGLGAATARNEGAARAMGRRLVFLDDDIEPTASLLEAHERTHSEGGPRQVVMGYSLPIIEGRLGFFTMALRNWWQDEFYAMRRPGHRYTYRDLLSGNFSIESQFFARLNGFDRAYPDCGGEDYEFG
ncbi:MAG: glycosyltransferase, partial [Acidobacteria bacterium]|nr:glycosyltransferase [Acidobacteriota bacterium]